MYDPINIINPTTLARTSNVIEIRDNYRGEQILPVHIVCGGLAGAETAKVQVIDELGNPFDYYVDGTLQEMKSDNTGVVIYAPGKYKIVKAASAASVSAVAYCGTEVALKILPDGPV